MRRLLLAFCFAVSLSLLAALPASADTASHFKINDQVPFAGFQVDVPCTGDTITFHGARYGRRRSLVRFFRRCPAKRICADFRQSSVDKMATKCVSERTTHTLIQLTRRPYRKFCTTRQTNAAFVSPLCHSIYQAPAASTGVQQRALVK